MSFDFIAMVGTTGITSDGTTLYIANNKKISFVKDDIKTDYTHPYKWVGGITVGGGKLYGICLLTTGEYSLFSMILSERKFVEVAIAYTPVNLIYTAHVGICVADTAGILYSYSDEMVLRNPYNFFNLPELPYRKVGMTQVDGLPLISLNKGLYIGPQKIFDLGKEIYSISRDGNKIWFLLEEGLQTYSIKAFNFYNELVETIQGGILPENDMYTCVYNNELYISSSVNKKVPLTPQSSNSQEPVIEGGSPNVFNKHVFNEYRSTYDPIQMKAKEESIVLEKKPVEKRLSTMYAWVAICMLLLLILGWSIRGSAPPILYGLLLFMGLILFLIATIL